MANILVTGSNGQLGNEIKELKSEFNHLNFIYTDVNELDITNVPMLKQFFNNNKINYIINCAAYTAVDKAEADIRTAEKINAIAVSNLVKLAANYKIKFFHISTDYIFDGNSKTPYTETSITNPQSAYGKTKLRGEIEASRYIQSIIIRTSWLYSSFGSNFVKTMLKLGNDHDEISVVSDQIGCPTSAVDLARVILRIISISEDKNEAFKPGIYNYSNEGSCSWYDFAAEIMKIANLKCKVKPIETSEYPTPAKRPLYSVLNTNKIINTFNIEIPQWQDSLEICLKKINQK